MNKIMYWLKNLLFILYLVSYIILVPNIFKIEIFGKIFLIIGILYTITFFILFLEKNDKLNYNIINNILSSLLYLYIFLIAYKYLTLKDMYIFNTNYFKFNYIMITISTIAIIFNNYLIKTENQVKTKKKCIYQIKTFT